MSNDLPMMPPAPEEERLPRAPDSLKSGALAELGEDSVGEVGACLAQLRVKRGMSQEEASARLKISVAKIKALEAGDLSRLKDATFALGIVRSYAKILGADPEPMVHVLRLAYGSNQQDLSMLTSSGASLPRAKMAVNWHGTPPRRSGGWQIGVVVVLLAIGIVLVFRDGRESSGWFSHLKSKNPDAVEASRAAGASSMVASDASSSSLLPAGKGMQLADTATNAAPSVAQITSAATAPGAPASTAKTTAPIMVAPSVASGAAQNDGAAAALGASIVASPGGLTTVTFTVSQDCWISVRQQDGSEVFAGLVHPGDGQQIEGTRPLKVTVGNVQSVEAIDIDGEKADLKEYLKATGNVAHFTLP